jgi:glyoxylase-like metal-dependent hydrolase (beta-lactamase superfamily II)
MQTRWLSLPVLALSALTSCGGASQPAAPAEAPVAPIPTEPVPEPAPTSKLNLQVLTASPAGFLVNSTLVSGEKEAVLIDAQFTLADAKALAKGIADSGKTLTTVYVTHFHPDHYFGFVAIKEAFPDAKLVALPATVSDIEKSWAEKVKTWKPLYKDAIPSKPIIPEALVGTSIDLEGEKLEIIGGLQGDAPNNSYVWIPTLNAVVSGDIVYDGVFPWTAETTPESRQAWSQSLDEIAARNAKIVVPGHQKPEQKQDPANIKFTKDYLAAYDTALQSSKTPEELQTKIKAQYPDTALDVILKLGSEASLKAPKKSAKK